MNDSAIDSGAIGQTMLINDSFVCLAHANDTPMCLCSGVTLQYLTTNIIFARQFPSLFHCIIKVLLFNSHDMCRNVIVCNFDQSSGKIITNALQIISVTTQRIYLLASERILELILSSNGYLFIFVMIHFVWCYKMKAFFF